MANIQQGLQAQINQANENRARAQSEQDAQNNYLQGREGLYGQREEGYRNQADTAYGDLARTPGYTDAEGRAITGNPNAGFNHYNPDALAERAANNANDVSGHAGELYGNLYNAASGIKGDLGNAAKNLGGAVTGAAGRYGENLTAAAHGLKSGLSDAATYAQSKLQEAPGTAEGYLGGTYNYLRGQNEGALGDLGSGLHSAVDPNKLGLSEGFTNHYALTPEQAQNIKDVAGNTVRGQYQRQNDLLDQRAFAQGDSSPAQIAALKQQGMRQGSIDAGDAMSSAELQANQEAARRQQTQEGMRIGTQQDIAGRQQANVGNIYGARQGAAQNLAGLEDQGIMGIAGLRQDAARTGANLGYESALQGNTGLYNAANAGGQADIDAAKTAGQSAYDAAGTGGAYGYNAANTGGQAVIDASKYGGTQQLGVAQGNQQTGQNLAVNADTTGSARAAGIAGQRIAGESSVRNYYTGQQGAAQQGGQTATGQHIQNDATQGGLANQATATASGTSMGQNQLDKQASPGAALAGGIASSLIGAGGQFATAKYADGGMIDSPTQGVVGEAGPEYAGPPEDAPAAIAQYYAGHNQGAQMQQPAGHGQKFKSGMMEGRGDGENVPGNEAGGANGQYGRFGQQPDQMPSQSFSDGVQRDAQQGQGWSRFGDGEFNAHSGIVQPQSQDPEFGGQQQNQPAADQSAYGQSEPTSGVQMDQQPQSGIGGLTGDGQPGQQNAAAVNQYQQPQQIQGSMNSGSGEGTPQQSASASAQPTSTAGPSQPQQSSTMDSPFGRMNFGAQGGQNPMAKGGIVTKPTRALLGENGPEVVIPLSGNPNAKVTPGLVGGIPRVTQHTGPNSLHNPMRPMASSLIPKKSGWSRWDSSHPRA
jgi:hypothetical protein